MGQAASRQEAFWEACGFGRKEVVRKFIEDGIDVNWVSYTHDSCAIHVASQGKIEIVKMLLNAGCNVNVKDDRGGLPLHHAAMKGHVEIMKLLLNAGSEIDTQDKNGWTPLLNASYWCQPLAVEALIEAKCDIQLMNKDYRTALHECCRSQSKEEEQLAVVASKLIQAGSNLEQKGRDIEVDFTPLMFASYHGHGNVVDVLIAAGCNINAVASNQWSALHWAADKGHEHVIKRLLDAGIDQTLADFRGERAVDRARTDNIRSMLKLEDTGIATMSPRRDTIQTIPSRSTNSSNIHDFRDFVSAAVPSKCKVIRKTRSVDLPGSSRPSRLTRQGTVGTCAPTAVFDDSDLDDKEADTGKVTSRIISEPVNGSVVSSSEVTTAMLKTAQKVTEKVIRSAIDEVAGVTTVTPITNGYTADQERTNGPDVKMVVKSVVDNITEENAAIGHVIHNKVDLSTETANNTVTNSSPDNFLFTKMDRWNVEDVCQWLKEIRLDTSIKNSFVTSNVDGQALKRLDITRLTNITPDLTMDEKNKILIERDAHLEFESECNK